MFPQLQPNARLDRLPPQMVAEATLLLIEAGRSPEDVLELTGLWPGGAARCLRDEGPFRRDEDFNSTRPKGETE